MGVRVRFGCGEAVLEDGVWASERASLAGVLNSLMDPFGYGPNDPHPDLNAARALVVQLGGEIVGVPDALPCVEGRVY